jgi:hypothetical protein
VHDEIIHLNGAGHGYIYELARLVQIISIPPESESIPVEWGKWSHVVSVKRLGFFI